VKKVRRTTVKTSGACIRSTRIIYCRIYRLADMQRDLFCPVAMMDPPKSNQCRFPTFLEWIHILFPISADFPPSSNGFISCSQSMPISPLPQLDSYLVPNECRFPPFLKWIHVENRSCNGTLFHSNKQCRYQNEGNLQNTEANYSRFRAKHGLMTPFVWFQYMGTWSNLKKGPTRAI
jgi:hypothetical protein